MAAIPINKATSPNGKFGVFDTQDKSWMGDDDGPLRYKEEFYARAAATVINEQFKSGARFRACRIEKGPFQVKDSITAPITAGEAIANIEAKVRSN